MGRRIVKIVSGLDIVLAIVIYFFIDTQFKTDYRISQLLETTNALSTLLRLSIYSIPGVHLICGLFGLVFSNKKLLFFIDGVQLLSVILMLIFLKGNSERMLYISLVSIGFVVIYFIGTLLIKNKPKRTEYIDE